MPSVFSSREGPPPGTWAERSSMMGTILRPKSRRMIGCMKIYCGIIGNAYRTKISISVWPFQKTATSLDCTGGANNRCDI